MHDMSTAIPDRTAEIEKWFDSRCNGVWEHSKGISIASTDNPGWLVEIDVDEEMTAFTPISRGECRDNIFYGDWLSCEIKEGKFVGAGRHLFEILDVFIRCVQTRKPDRQ